MCSPRTAREFVEEPGPKTAGPGLSEASFHEDVDLAAELLDERFGVLVARVAAARRVGRHVPPAEPDQQSREPRPRHSQLSRALGCRYEPDNGLNVAPLGQVLVDLEPGDAIDHEARRQSVDDVACRLSKTAIALRVRDPAVGLVHGTMMSQSAGRRRVPAAGRICVATES